MSANGGLVYPYHGVKPPAVGRFPSSKPYVTSIESSREWVSDIIYIPPRLGYLAGINALYSLEIAGFRPGRTTGTLVVLAALMKAAGFYCPLVALILYSDRGSPCCCADYQVRRRAYGLSHQQKNRYGTTPMESLGLEVMGCPIAKAPLHGPNHCKSKNVQ